MAAKKARFPKRTPAEKAEAFAKKVGALRAACEPLGVRLLSKAEVLAVVGISYPALWKWMRDGKFPRSRLVGNKSMWLSTDIAAWLTALPPCRLKGDSPADQTKGHGRGSGEPRPFDSDHRAKAIEQEDVT
jgi:predicted DNA-binding transcriptional regulator AlpA